MVERKGPKPRGRRQEPLELSSTMGESFSSLGSTDTMSSTRSRATPRRAHLQRAASVRKIGRTVSSSSFMQHKRVKSQRRIQRSINNMSSRSLVGSESLGGQPGNGRHVGRSLSSDDLLRRPESESLYAESANEDKRKDLGRSFSSDDVLRYQGSRDSHTTDVDGSQDSDVEDDREYKKKKEKQGAPTAGLMGAVTGNYEKALAKVSLLFSSVDDSDTTKKSQSKSRPTLSGATLSGGKNSSKAKKKDKALGIPKLSAFGGSTRNLSMANNYEEALAKAVQRFNV